MPVLDALVELVTRGRCIPVHLSPLPRLEALVAEVQAWKECAAHTFLMENSPYSLLEVSAGLTPQVPPWWGERAAASLRPPSSPVGRLSQRKYKMLGSQKHGPSRPPPPRPLAPAPGLAGDA